MPTRIDITQIAGDVKRICYPWLYSVLRRQKGVGEEPDITYYHNVKEAKGPSKHQIRSEATRTALLKAAEDIFARDGYERAQIDEIAKISGRTRGAVYAQYKTKEQLFFAVQERRIRVATKNIESRFAKMQLDDFHGRWEAIREYFSGLQDEKGSILDLELKLYALRHPESMADWQERYRKLFPAEHFGAALGLVQQAGRSKVESRIESLGGLKGGLVVTMKFTPNGCRPKKRN